MCSDECPSSKHVILIQFKPPVLHNALDVIMHIQSIVTDLWNLFDWICCDTVSERCWLEIDVKLLWCVCLNSLSSYLTMVILLPVLWGKYSNNSVNVTPGTLLPSEKWKCFMEMNVTLFVFDSSLPLKKWILFKRMTLVYAWTSSVNRYVKI